MESAVHDQENRLEIPLTPPRTFVLILSSLLVMLVALLAGNSLSAPSTSAQAPTSYDLCQRTTAVRHEILFALQYPNRDRGRAVSDNRYLNGHATNTNNNLSTYPQATWGTLDTSNDNGVYTTDPCSTPGATLTITATALASDAAWGGWRQAFKLINKSLTALIPSDFAGLTEMKVIYITGNSITSIPDNIFEDTGTITVASISGNTGLAPSCDWFGSFARHVTEMDISGSGITHADIPPDAFDNCFNSSQSTVRTTSQLARIKLRDQQSLGHVNTRWFARLPNLDNIQLHNSLVDTYFYAEGPTAERSTIRYVNGAKSQVGANNVSAANSVNRDALGTAIKAEIDRYWASTGKAGTVPAAINDGANIGTSNGVQGMADGFNMCDRYDRSEVVSTYIISKFKDPDGDSNTPAPAAYASLGCGDGEVPYLTKEQAYNGFFWDTWRRPFFPFTGNLRELRKSDLKGLRVTGVKLTGSSIETLPAGIFEGSNIAYFDAKWQRRFQFDPKSWYGTSASVVETLTVPNSLANSSDIKTFDYFDGFTSLRSLDLRNTEFGFINTRWFERLADFRDLKLGGAFIAKYYYDADGNDTTSTGNADYWDFASLQTAITSARTTYGTTQTVSFGNTPPKIAVDICWRPKIVWAEMMRLFQYLEGDDDPRSGRYVTNAGDVRHARYGAVNQSDCRAVPGLAVVKSGLAPVNPESTTFDASIHGRTIYKSGVNIRMRLNDSADLGPELNPAHFADFENVQEIHLNNSGITTIPHNTFAEAPNIRRLSLSGNSLDNADFSGSNFLRNFTELRVLTLSDNLLTEFDSSWLPTAMRDGAADPLRTLILDNNPIKTVDMSGLDLTDLRLNSTNITSIDDSILELDNLARFWYQSQTLRLGGLHSSGVTAFLDALPGTLVDSQPPPFIGNELRIADDDLNSSAVNFQLNHQARLKAINDADNGNDQVRVAFLSDPCQGSRCLTEAQKNSFIDSLASYNGLNWVNVYNANLSSAQVARIIRSVDGQPMQRLAFVSNPNAFGSGFDNSVFSTFADTDWRTLWQIRIIDSGLTFTQAEAFFDNLKDAYEPSTSRDSDGNLRWTNHYLTHIDLSYNSGLFTGATTAGLEGLLGGVTAVRPDWGPLNLAFSNTNLDFDKLKAIIDGIDQYADAPDNAHGIRSLDVSGNRNLWNRLNTSSGQWENVSISEIGRLVDRLRGLTSLNISDTGLTVQELSWIMNSLSANNSTLNLGIKSSMARMAGFAVAGTDLGAALPQSLRNTFSYFGGRYATATPALRSLVLARTGIDCTDLINIADGLETAGVLSSISYLNVDGNPNIFSNCPTPDPPSGLSPSARLVWLSENEYTACDPTSATDPVVTLFARFTNLRIISFDDTAADFNELQCVVEGLDKSDGTDDDVVTQVRTFSVMDNTMAFTVPATDTTEAMAAPKATVATFFQKLPNAWKVLTNTGLTTDQATAALEAEQEGQSEDEQRETARRFAAQNPAFTFKTPLPDDLRVESGRSSVRVTFTHDPMHNNQRFTVLRYEYRYRVQSSDPWGNTDSEMWRTASIKLEEFGPKSFEIYGLEPDTVYQVQLRASSLARPAVTEESGGTSINLPTVNKIEPAITEVSMRAGDTVRLEVDVYGLSGVLDNTLPKSDDNDSKLIFRWSENPSGGSFATPDSGRRVVYTAPSLPGTYTVTVEAQPDGICRDHHETNFDISDADREACMATITVRVSRAPTVPEPPAEPINPAGIIPSSMTDSSGVAYAVFTPVDGGTFTGTGITVTAAKGAVPDRQLLGVSAAVSSARAPEPVPGARMTVSGDLYDIMAIEQDGSAPVIGFTLDDPIMACLPMPTAFRANISDVVVVERKLNGSYGILSTKLRQTGGDLSVCGNISTLPATIGIAKLGEVPAPPPPPTPTVETPATGATAPSGNLAAYTLAIGLALLAGIVATAAAIQTMRRRGSTRHP